MFVMTPSGGVLVIGDYHPVDAFLKHGACHRLHPEFESKRIFGHDSLNANQGVGNDLAGFVVVDRDRGCVSPTSRCGSTPGRMRIFIASSRRSRPIYQSHHHAAQPAGGLRGKFPYRIAISYQAHEDILIVSSPSRRGVPAAHVQLSVIPRTCGNHTPEDA
jgi:hypothetical protein